MENPETIIAPDLVSGGGDKTRWTGIGAAWPNRDGQGFTLVFDALPLDGRVVMREIDRENEDFVS